MWKSIYDGILQSMTISWGNYIAANQECGTLVRDTFHNDIYPEIGIYLLVIPLAFSLLYYYYLNYNFGKYYSRKAWIATLVTASILVGVITYFRSASILGEPGCNVSKHIIWIAIINMVYSAILFSIYSLLLKWKSPMGKRTPF